MVKSRDEEHASQLEYTFKQLTCNVLQSCEVKVSLLDLHYDMLLYHQVMVQTK